MAVAVDLLFAFDAPTRGVGSPARPTVYQRRSSCDRVPQRIAETPLANGTGQAHGRFLWRGYGDESCAVQQFPRTTTSNALSRRSRRSCHRRVSGASRTATRTHSGFVSWTRSGRSGFTTTTTLFRCSVAIGRSAGLPVPTPSSIHPRTSPARSEAWAAPPSSPIKSSRTDSARHPRTGS